MLPAHIFYQFQLYPCKNCYKKDDSNIKKYSSCKGMQYARRNKLNGNISVMIRHCWSHFHRCNIKLTGNKCTTLTDMHIAWCYTYTVLQCHTRFLFNTARCSEVRQQAKGAVSPTTSIQKSQCTP